MTVRRAFTVIGLAALIGAVVGALLDYCLGLWAPAYYRGVFASGREPWFEPTQVGLGLGLTQGLIGGTLVGAVVVLAVAWYTSRSTGPAAEDD